VAGDGISRAAAVATLRMTLNTLRHDGNVRHRTRRDLQWDLDIAEDKFCVTSISSFWFEACVDCFILFEVDDTYFDY